MTPIGESMSPKNIIAAALVLFHLTGCKAAQEQSTVAPLSAEVSEEGRTLRQTMASSSQQPDGELSCLQQCGREARGTVYADCLSEGGERETCGATGREWYRSCLEERCDEAAIQLDDCRTACRITAKEAHVACVSNAEEPEVCQTEKGNNIRTCIAECE